MRINEITNLAYAVTVALTVLSGTAFILSGYSADQERRAVEEHITLDSLAEELALGAELRSDDARLYILRGDDRFLGRFYVEENKERAKKPSTLSRISGLRHKRRRCFAGSSRTRKR